MFPRGCLVALLAGASACAEPQPRPVTFLVRDGAVEIRVGEAVFATYVYEDPNIPRPFFANIYAPDGTRVTRAFPAGPDDDHGDMHPGLWMSFGDINGHDFWRNKARTKHTGFVEPPQAANGIGTFAVENAYLAADGTSVASEIARFEITSGREGTLLLWTSEIRPTSNQIVFGDQEEMGLGVRVRAEISVDNGGTIRNDAGAENEAGVWGKPAQSASYSGLVKGERIGVAIMNHPENFRTPWWHARDYGLLVANPFGRNAMTGGKKSAVTVDSGESLSLRYAVFVYTGTPNLEDHPLASQTW